MRSKDVVHLVANHGGLGLCEDSELEFFDDHCCSFRASMASRLARSVASSSASVSVLFVVVSEFFRTFKQLRRLDQAAGAGLASDTFRMSRCKGRNGSTPRCAYSGSDRRFLTCSAVIAIYPSPRLDGICRNFCLWL